MRFELIEACDNNNRVVVSMHDVVWDGSLNHLINTLDAANKNITTITFVRESSVSENNYENAYIKEGD